MLFFSFAINLLIFIPLYYSITRNVEEKYWLICVLIFVANPYMYVQTTFNLLRQCCATGIELIAVEFFKKRTLKSIILGIFVMFIAIQFHKSAIIILFLILPFLTNIRLNGRKWKIILIISNLISILFSNKIVYEFSNLFSYERYSEYDASLLNNYFYLLVVFIFTWWLCCNYHNFTDGNDFFVNLFMFTMCILPIAVKNNMIYRLRISLLFVTLPAIGKIYQRLDVQNGLKKSYSSLSSNLNKYMTKLYVLYYVAFFFAYFLYLSYKGITAYVPFRFYSLF